MAEQTRQQLRDERRQRIDARAQIEAGRDRRRRRQAILRVAIPVGIGVLILAAILFVAVQEATAPPPGDAFPLEGTSHVEPGVPINYPNYPPTSGTHFNTWARYGFSETPVDPGFWVHNLEHGYVAILYKCPADCTRLKQQLKDLYASLAPSVRYRYVKAVIAPDDGIDTPLVALAWGRRLKLDGYDDSQLRRFYQSFVDKGPEDAP